MKTLQSVLSFFLIIGFFHQFVLVVTEDQTDTKNNSIHDAENFRRNYTPNDLIQNLARLAEEELQPRFRFPTEDSENDPFYQSNLGDDDLQYSQQNYQQVQQQQQQNPYFGVNQDPQYNPGVFSGNAVSDGQFPQNNYQGQQFPQNTRRPKKQKLKRYRPQFPISQDALDPYYQNYPPYYPEGGRPQRPSFPATGGQGAYPNRFPPYYPGQQGYQDQGPFNGLMDALNSIAKNDDQQCVPRLLCEVAAGGNPSYRQASFLPSFLTTESLFTLLSALSGSVSPLLVFGRAALLGVTSQGRPTSCRYAYPECPTDPDRLVDYLNNHNGGFFRYFNGLSGQQSGFNQGQTGFGGLSNPQSLLNQQGLGGLFGAQSPLNQQGGLFGGQSSLNQQLLGGLQSILSQQGQAGGLLGSQNFQQRPFDQNLLDLYNQRPSYQNGFNRRPVNRPGQQYNPNVDFGFPSQRPSYESLYNRGDPNVYRRYPVIYDGQTRIANIGNDSEAINAESRILHKPLSSNYNDNHLTFVSYQNYRLPQYNDLDLSLSFHNDRVTNFPNSNKEIKFPESQTSNFIQDDNRYLTKSTLKFPDQSTSFSPNRNPKAIQFPNSQLQDNNLYYPKPLPFYDHTKMIFPDRTGTGNLKFDSDKLNPNYRPDIEFNNNYYYAQNRPFHSENQYYGNSQEYYRQEPSKKKYVYIVRGNGDPNHPEIVEDVRGRNGKELVEEDSLPSETAPAVNTEKRKDGQPWLFPSSYQGVTYND